MINYISCEEIFGVKENLEKQTVQKFSFANKDKEKERILGKKSADFDRLLLHQHF